MISKTIDSNKPVMKINRNLSKEVIEFVKSASILKNDNKMDRKLRLILLALMTYPSDEFIEKIYKIVLELKSDFCTFSRACVSLYTTTSISEYDMSKILTNNDYKSSLNSIILYHTNHNKDYFKDYYAIFVQVANMDEEYVSVSNLYSLIKGVFTAEFNRIMFYLNAIEFSKEINEQITCVVRSASSILINNTIVDNFKDTLNVLHKTPYPFNSKYEILLRTYQTIYGLLCKSINFKKGSHCNMKIF